jgi:putative spermidine/putrescine transport system permease protein
MTQGSAVRMTASIDGSGVTPVTKKKRRGSLVWWVVFVLGMLYFFLPLLATLLFTLKPKVPFYSFTVALGDPALWNHLGYSFAIALVTMVATIGLMLPTAYWVRLKVPKLRPAVEFVTLMPFVLPAVILVFGLIRVYGSSIPLLSTSLGSDFVLVGAYMVLSMPYMYRAIDTGLRAIDIRSLTEAAQSLGAGWPTIILRVILPNVRVAMLSGAFLTLAIVMGEFTISNYLDRPAFGPYLSLLGNSQPYPGAAVALISFALTWLAMGMIAYLGRGSRSRLPTAAVK